MQVRCYFLIQYKVFLAKQNLSVKNIYSYDFQNFLNRALSSTLNFIKDLKKQFYEVSWFGILA